MRHQRKVSENNKFRLLIIGVIGLIIGLYYTTTMILPKQIVSTQEVDIEYKTYVYTVTYKEGSEVYGKDLNDDTGIFFNLNEVDLSIPVEKSIEEGTKIKVYMNSINHIEGIEKVEVIE